MQAGKLSLFKQVELFFLNYFCCILFDHYFMCFCNIIYSIYMLPSQKELSRLAILVKDMSVSIDS